MQISWFLQCFRFAFAGCLEKRRLSWFAPQLAIHYTKIRIFPLFISLTNAGERTNSQQNPHPTQRKTTNSMKNLRIFFCSVHVRPSRNAAIMRKFPQVLQGTVSTHKTLATETEAKCCAESAKKMRSANVPSGRPGPRICPKRILKLTHEQLGGQTTWKNSIS